MKNQLARFILISLFIGTNLNASSQIFENELIIYVKDSISKEAIFGAKVVLTDISEGFVSDEEGKVVFTNLPKGDHTLSIRHLSYKEYTTSVTIPLEQDKPVLIFYLSPVETDFDAIIVEATRANRSIEDLPTRTEVLTEEIDEAASMEPSKIAHLITHSTGIQVQTTAASSNGAVVRIQGMQGRYTQMLKDGFPMYGGFSGSLDILQIPPLDLRQVEYVKGPASTLYGGGAIGGLVNLLSKKGDKDESLLHLNISHIGAKDFNAFTSRTFDKFAFTNLASMHFHSPYDADNDDYADIPEVIKFNFNPKFFYRPSDKTEFYLGANISNESRTGGDMFLINSKEADTTHFYLDDQESRRYTSQFSYAHDFNKIHSIRLKNSVSSFERQIQLHEDTLSNITFFGGQQINSFSELNYNYNKDKHNLTVGFNLYTDAFMEEEQNSIGIRNQSYLTNGLFLNYLWNITEKIMLESGLRSDFVQAKSDQTSTEGDLFVLPRLSSLFKLHKTLSLRIGGGMGYRMPTIFNEESEPFAYKNIQAIDFNNVEAEESIGGNFDLKYQSTFGSDNILLTLNQMFFYNTIENPIRLYSDTTGALNYRNSDGQMISQGFESQIKLTVWKFTWFFGYTYTNAFYSNSTANESLILTPVHSIKGDLLFVEDNKWRIGWDYEYKSAQLLSSGLYSPELFTTGIVVERTLNHIVLFLNAENFTDTRQTRTESILSGPNKTPQFTDIWGPLDGFFFNAGIKIKL